MDVTSHPVIESFLANYLRFQDYYRRAAELCHDMCHDALRTSGIRHISTFRAKGVGRLRDKLYQRVPKNSYATEADILNDIVDLCGVRIALYLPGQRDDAVRLLSDLLDIEHVRTFPAPDEKRRGNEAYVYTFSGYAATHLHARMKAAQLSGDTETAEAYTSARIEIQVASVLTHAWAEVEHDLVYKPVQGELTLAEYAWLDQVNGLVAAGDFALEQLQRTMLERGAATGEAFENHYDLASYIHSRVARSKRPEPRMGRADLLLEFLAALNLNRPSGIQHVVKSLAKVQVGRTLVDSIVDAIIESEPTKRPDSERIWADIQSAADGPNPYGDEQLIAHNLQSRIKKHWATFDDAAWRVVRQMAPRANRGPHSWMDLDSLKEPLGFDEPTAVAVIAANQAYLHVSAELWQGTNDQLEKHARTLEDAIARLYISFPDLLAISGSEG